MIEMSFNYDNSLFIGFEIMTGKVDNDETLQNVVLFGRILIYSC